MEEVPKDSGYSSGFCGHWKQGQSGLLIVS